MAYRDVFPTGNTQFPLAVARRNPQVGRTQRETWHPQLNVFGNFVVAGCAAVPARVAVHPFSVMRACAGAGLPGHKMGPVQAAYWMLKVEGRSSFLKAVIPSAIKSFPQIGLQFCIYGELSKQIVPDVAYGKYSLMGVGANFIAGAVAGAVTQSLLQPFDVIKTRLCVQGFRTKNVYEGALDCARKIVVKDGLAGLYKGFLPSVMGAYIYCGVMFSGWDLVNRLPWRRNDVSIFYFDMILFPAGVLATATACSLPFDVLRRKMMAYDPSLPKNGNCDVAASTLRDAVVNTYKDAGFPGFLRGFFASVIKSAPQAVVFYFAFKVAQKGAVATIGSREKAKK